MRIIATAFGIAVMGTVLPLTAQVTETKEKTETTEHADGSVTEKQTTTTRTFAPDVEKRVVKYFEPFKTERYGLPPAWVTTVKVKEMPATWRTTRLSNGMVITEKERPFLMPAPPELIKILPAPREEVRYYVAGSNVVAVDKEYKVVDAIQVPSIKITVDD